MNEVLRTPCKAAGVLIELESLVSARSASYSDVRHRTLSGRCVAQQLDVQKAIPYSCARPESEHIGVAPRQSRHRPRFASGVAACRCCIGQRTRRPMQMRPGRFGPHRFAPRRVYCRTRSGSRCVRAVGGRRRQPFSGGRLHSATQFEGRLDAPECFLGAAAAIADDVALVEEATRHALIDGDRFDLSSSQ